MSSCGFFSFKAHGLSTGLFLILGLGLLGCGGSFLQYPAAPVLLPGVSRPMKTPGFWVSRQAAPDQVILTSNEIVQANQRLRSELLVTRDLEKEITNRSPVAVKQGIEETWKRFFQKKHFGPAGKKMPINFYARVKEDLALDEGSFDLAPQPGFVVYFSDQRFLPTEEPLLAAAFDADFDELQNSDLDAGTPVIVWRRTRDGAWSYVQSSLSEGWVKSAHVALGDWEQWRNFLETPEGIVVTAAKADVYLDEDLTRHYDYARMGSRWPGAEHAAHTVKVKWPIRKADGQVAFVEAYLKKEEVSIGFLPYTTRAVIEQAFKLLNAPYGWGGRGGEQDCSRLIQAVFAVFGFELPRDSIDQARVGRTLAQFSAPEDVSVKKEILIKEPAGCLLYLKGHIMLYLGTVEGTPYAIHATWGYREPGFSKDRVRVVNRVVVSDLNLGEGSRKGSLLQRLLKIIQVP